MSRLSRRLITVPLSLIALPLWLLLTPLTVPALVVSDLVLGRWRLPLLRLWLFVPPFVVLDLYGIFGGLWVWLFGGVGSSTRFETESRMQGRWAGALLKCADRLLGVRLDLDDRPLPSGTVIVLSRHASMADAIIPAYLFPRVFERPVHYVLKRELGYLPAIDIIGNRLGNHFVTRGGDTDREVAQIARLADESRPDAGLVIFPEGTYSTPTAKERVGRSLARRGDTAGVALNDELEHLLPPKVAGALTLLERCPDAKVVLFAHTGLEGVAEFRGLRRNLPLRRPVTVRWWSVDRPEPGAGRDSTIEWLNQRWRELDQWVSTTKAVDRSN